MTNKKAYSFYWILNQEEYSYELYYTQLNILLVMSISKINNSWLFKGNIPEKKYSTFKE